MKTKHLALNAVIAALYVVVTITFPSFTALQLRASEIFAHLPIFNKKYSVGLLLGVAIANFWSPFGLIDVTFGSLHSALSIIIALFLTRHVKTMYLKLIINATVFSLMSFIIALMIKVMDPVDLAFWPLYGSIAFSIFIVMIVGIPIIMFIDKSVKFNQSMTK